jgi:hypothetical protein
VKHLSADLRDLYGSAERDRQTSCLYTTHGNSHTTHMTSVVQQCNATRLPLISHPGISTRSKQDILRNSHKQIGDLPLVHVLGCRSVHAIRSKIPSRVFTPYPKYNCCESTNIDTTPLPSIVGHSSIYCILKAPRTSTRRSENRSGDLSGDLACRSTQHVVPQTTPQTMGMRTWLDGNFSTRTIRRAGRRCQDSGVEQIRQLTWKGYRRGKYDNHNNATASRTTSML